MNAATPKHLSQTDAVILLCTFGILFFFIPIGGTLDQLLIQPWINQTGQFYLNDNWYLTFWNHGVFKNILITLYAVFLVLWLLSFFMNRFKPNRFIYGYLFLACGASTAIIGLLKSNSPHACPKNMLENTTNGFVWDFSASNGHCFPGGHASTGFALLAGYFVYRLSQPQRAKIFLYAALIVGFILGWGQMMRGEHFLSHNLWTAWIIYAFNSAIFFIIAQKFPQRLTPTPNGSRSQIK